MTPEKYCITNTQSVGSGRLGVLPAIPDRAGSAAAAHGAQLARDLRRGGLVPPTAAAAFQQRIRDGVFDTFESFLTSYSISPLLGIFQTWVSNRPEHNGIKPNENYARELMQLMTIGVSELNEDGTLVLDAPAGRSRPTVNPTSRRSPGVLTGYDFPPLPPGAVGAFGNEYYVGDMEPIDPALGTHDQAAKSRARRTAAVAGRTAARRRRCTR